MFMKKEERLNLIKKDLKKSSKILVAISEENRQKILLILLENCVIIQGVFNEEGEIV